MAWGTRTAVPSALLLVRAWEMLSREGIETPVCRHRPSPCAMEEGFDTVIFIL